MTPAPSRFAETVVGFVLPPSAREHVLGDLHERYQSSRQYWADAIRTVPRVILSRMRRATDMVVLLMEICTTYMSFFVAAWQLGGVSFLYRNSGFVRSAIPTAVVLLILVISDTYASARTRSPLRPILGAVVAVACAFLTRAMPLPIMVAGGSASLLLIATLRLLFPPPADRPQSVDQPAFWQKSELVPIRWPRRTVIRAIIVAVLVLLIAYAVVSSAQGQTITDTDIRKILADRIDAQRQSYGIVVGVIDPTGRRVVAYGSFDKNDKRTPNGDTVFEIGSITKVFTALLLADMAQRGEVSLTDPVAKYLPKGVKMPERNGHAILLQDLATHTSGLPRLPSNMAPKDPVNPYADYTPELLYQFLSSYEPSRDPGEKWVYSNLGAGLLGHVLALRAGMDYESLVRLRITTPLGMKSTAIALSPELKARMTPGHNGELAVVPTWDFQAMAGAGALRSTADDLLIFLAANLGETKTSLAPAMAEMLKVRRPTGVEGLENALAWQISSQHGKEIVWKDGGTYGYASFIGFDPKAHTGVVVLSNTFTMVGVNDIGLHLLDPQSPLHVSKEHKEITLDPKSFDPYVGLYELAPNAILTITRQDNHFYAQLTGQPRFEIYPESLRDFFLKVVDAQLTFESGAVVLHQNGRDQRAKRIEGEPPKAKEHKQVAVDPKLFDGYVGRYQLAPSFILTVTRDGDRLLVQATNQPQFEVFPESDRDFFYKVVDAQITFETDPQGRATALVLHQNGLDQRAKRIE